MAGSSQVVPVDEQVHAPADLEVVSEPERAAVLLNTTRQRVLAALAHEPASAAGLARTVGIPRQLLNYHLRQLEAEGHVTLVEERRRGNCIERVLRASAASYVVDPGALGPVAADPARATDTLSTAYLVSVAARAIRELAGLRRSAARAGKRLATLTIDTEVRFASAADQAAFGDELAELTADLVRRYHTDTAPRGRRFRLLAASYPMPGGRRG